MAFADANGIRLHHRLDGDAGRPVLVLSSSLGTGVGLWEPQVEALARRFRVLRYDTRGHGASEVPPGPYTIELLGRDVLGLLDALDVRQAAFCGLSLGGMTGMWLAAHAPERVRALVLANTAAQLGPPGPWDERIAAVRAGGTAALAEAVMGRWFTPRFRAERPAEVERVRRMLLSTPPEGYAGACAAIRDLDLRPDLARIRAPTLVVVGAADAATPPAAGRHLAEHVSGARLVELEAAHLSNVEAAGPFTAALLDFFAGAGV